MKITISLFVKHSDNQGIECTLSVIPPNGDPDCDKTEETHSGKAKKRRQDHE